MEKITPCLWFNSNAEEAAKFYTSVFPKSKIIEKAVYGDSAAEVSGQKKGSVLTVEVSISGHHFTLLNGGPIFKPNPSLSFFLNFDPSKDKKALENLNSTWEKLSSGGKVLMEIMEYPFSKRYGWLEDKFGVSWQLMLTDKKGEERPFIIPSIMFVGNNAGKAKEATDFYISVFKNSKRGTYAPYPKGAAFDKEGSAMFTDFMLEKQWFAAMDSAAGHKFSFNEGVSLVINCKDQKEVDYFWDSLIKGGGRESMCGWLKDKYGFNWQVVPSEMSDMFSGKDKASERAMAAMLKMTKLDINELKKAYKGGEK